MRNHPDACQHLIEMLLNVKIEKMEMHNEEVMDLDSLKKGDFYKDLKDSYVIFICLEDIFQKGLPVYAFENGRIKGDQERAFEDARNLYKNGVSVDIIAKSLGMTLEQIKEIVSDEEVMS